MGTEFQEPPGPAISTLRSDVQDLRVRRKLVTVAILANKTMAL
jgi:hypothetical protein